MCTDLMGFLDNNYNFIYCIMCAWFLIRKSNKALFRGALVIPMASPFSFGLASLTSLLLINNVAGLFPYCNSLRVNYPVILLVAGFFWMSPLMRDLTNNFPLFFAKLIPGGTPLILSPFICLIEIVSILIRPLSLTIRLVANVIAGHVVLRLVSALLLYFPTSFIIYLVYYTVEVTVACIQTYIFCLLLLMYEQI